MRIRLEKPNYELWSARTLLGIPAKLIAGILKNKTPHQLFRWEKSIEIPSLPHAIVLAMIYKKPVEELFPDLVKKIREEVEKDEKYKNLVSQRSEFLGPPQ